MATNQITKAAALLCLNIEGAGVRVQSRISSAFSKLANTTSKNSVYVHLYSSGTRLKKKASGSIQTCEFF